MSGGNKALVVALVGTLGLWGCARGPASSAGAERMKALEFKVAKLEDDFRAATAMRDLLRQKLESQTAQLQGTTKERDDIRKQVLQRTTEREAIQTQYDQFRKQIRELLGQAEAAVGIGLPQPVTAAAPPGSPGRS
jgi:uncharacterized coiled-coil DUF342 family protein